MFENKTVDISGAGGTGVTGETFYGLLCENLKERDFLGNLDTDWRIT
jgi:hypothetical protein